MQYKSRCTSWRWRAVLIVFVTGLVSVTIFRISSAAWTGYGTSGQQDVIRLENRINQIEQRLYSIETSLRNLEQQSRVAGLNSRGGNQEDWTLLRSQIQALQHRLLEDECALAKLDERTLTPAMRAARRRSGAASDACRENPNEPLHLSDRR